MEEVSTEKSTKGLAEIYEDEYMLQMHNLDKKKDELDKKKVRLIMRRLLIDGVKGYVYTYLRIFR